MKCSLRSVPYSPRGVSIAELHHCLSNHLYPIGTNASLICSLCTKNEVVDKPHLILCPSQTKAILSDSYWESKK